MKLNKYIREAFVRAAMNDVPAIDYAQQARDLALKTANDLLPPEIKPLIDNPALTGCFNYVYVDMPGNLSGVRVLGHPDTWRLRYEPKAAEVWTQLQELSRLDKEQNERRKELKSKLEGAAAAVTTRKALVAMLPEFEKYLPPEDAPSIKTLPVCANLVSDFMQAGWPKEKTA